MSVRANKCIFYHEADSVMKACYFKGFAMPCKMALNQVCRDFYLKSNVEKGRLKCSKKLQKKS